MRMKGSHRIIVESRKVKYDFTIKRNITILTGDSGSGKTVLIELIRDYRRYGSDSGVFVSCDRDCRTIDNEDWERQISEISDSIIFIDEGNRFLTSKKFAELVQKSDNYFVIATREKLPMLPYSVNEIYGFRKSGKFHEARQTYNEIYHLYGEISEHFLITVERKQYQLRCCEWKIKYYLRSPENRSESFLYDLGINMDNAPDADVLSNPQNTVVRDRSFGSDCEVVSEMALAELRGLESQGVIGLLKHFPGHGATAGDTHEGYAYTDASLEEMMANELVPFADGIEAGVDVIMVGHISCPKVTGDDLPASLSEKMTTQILRQEMGYDGFLITDAMNMGAVSENYSSSEAAVAAIRAGIDMILMPQDFQQAYEGILNAVESGELTEERIDESLRRITALKLKISGESVN